MFLRLQFCLLVLVAMLPQFSDSLLLSSTRKISERPPPSTTRTTLHATHQRGSGGGSTATTTGTGTASSSTTTKRHQPRRWHRRVWSKIVRRDSSVPLQMVATAAAVAGGEVEIDQETEALLDSIAMYQQKRGRSNNKNSSHRDLILSNFEAVSPHDILPKDKAVVQQPPQAQAKPQTLDEEFFDVSITSTPSQEKEELRKNGGGGTSISLPGLLAMLVENIVTGRIVKHATQTPQGLDIQVVPLDNSMGRLLTRFQFMADIYIAATDRLVFPNIRFSGGQLVAEQMTINLMGFLQSRRASGIRYPRQFDIHAHGLTMTSNDVANSSCIRNGLRQLLINILKDRGVQSSSIQITSVDILVRSLLRLDWFCQRIHWLLLVHSHLALDPLCRCQSSRQGRSLVKEMHARILDPRHCLLRSGLVWHLKAVATS